MIDFVSVKVPHGSGVALDPPPSSQADNAFTPAFATALRHASFAVAEASQPAPDGAHHVRYLVTPQDDGDLVRLTIDGNTTGARFFMRNPDGALRPGGPITFTREDASR